MFENKVLGKTFELKRDEKYRRMEKLCNAELHALHSSHNIIKNLKSRRMIWAEHVVRMQESRNAYTASVGRTEGKRLLGRPRCWWEDNIEKDLREAGCDAGCCICLLKDRNQWRAYTGC